MTEPRPEYLLLRQVGLTLVILVLLSSGAVIGTGWTERDIRTLDAELSDVNGPVRDVLVQIEHEIEELEDEIFWWDSQWQAGDLTDEAFRNRVDAFRNLYFDVVRSRIDTVASLVTEDGTDILSAGDLLLGDWEEYVGAVSAIDPAEGGLPGQMETAGDRLRQSLFQIRMKNQVNQSRTRQALAQTRRDARRRQTALVGLLGLAGIATFGWSARVIWKTLRSEQNTRETLRASQERFALAVQAAGDGVWDWNILTGEAYLSDRWCRLLGYRPDELPRNVDTWRSHLHPDEAEDVDARLRRHLQVREPYDVEYRLRTKSGEYRWFRVRGQAVWDADGKPIRMVGSLADVTEVRNATEALVRSEERYRQLFDLAQEGIWVLDADDRTIFVNPSMSRILGYSEEEMIGRPLLSFVDAEDQAAVEAVWKHRRTDDSNAAREVSMTRKDGSRAYLLIDTSPIDYGGGKGTIAGVADITARRQAELSLRQRLAMEEILADVSSSLINVAVERIDDVIENSLLRIGEFLEADHSRLLLFSEDRSEVTLTHLWSRSGKGGDLHSYTFIVGDRPWVTDPLLEGRPSNVVMEEDTTDDGEPGTLESLGCRAILRVPISFENSVIGFIALGFLDERHGSSEEIELLRALGQVFSNALNRKRSERRLRSALTEVHRLKERLEAENVYLQEEVRTAQGFGDLIGSEKNFLECVRLAETAAPTTVPVLITGDTGSGKELFARAIHELSPRKDRPLISVNCAALPPSLIESELFGHERGAFTGAERLRRGRFEIADGSTLFLDEIGDLPLDLQGKLLRVLQEGKIERLGSATPIAVDVRIVTATNRNLRRAVDLGEFRADLFFRINTFPIHLPSLEDRPGDIPILAKHFVRKHAHRLGRKVRLISSATLAELSRRQWPGNVRELEHFIERALISSRGSVLEISDAIPSTPSAPGRRERSEPPTAANHQRPKPASPEALQDFEREHILEILGSTGWVIEGENGAANRLGVAPSTLRSKMKRLGIRRPKLAWGQGA